MQYTELSANQREAVGKPCRKCGKGTYVERSGTYGLWVQCNAWPCKGKVYRPRGAWVARGKVETGGQVITVPPIQPEPEPISGTWSTEAVKSIATELDLAQAAKLETLLGNELAKLRAEQVAQLPTVIEVQRGGEVVARVENAHYLMPRLLTLLGADFNVYVWGPAGSGKTTAALQAAAALGRQGEIDTLDPTTFRSMVQGYMTPTGEPVHTSFTRCWVQGKVYVADETDNAPGHVQTLFNSALANGHAPLAWGNVARTDGFLFIGTGNTPGRPTREFPDRRPMSAAFMDRLYFMYWPLDPAIECRAAGLPIPHKDKPSQTTVTGQAWVKWVQQIREWCKENMPTLQVTPRASLIGLKALELGESALDVAHALVFRGADSEMVNKALSAVRLV